MTFGWKNSIIFAEKFIEMVETFKIRRGDKVYYIDYDNYCVCEGICSDECYMPYDNYVTEAYIRLDNNVLIPYSQSAFADYESAYDRLTEYVKRGIADINKQIEFLERKREKRQALPL